MKVWDERPNVFKKKHKYDIYLIEHVSSIFHYQNGLVRISIFNENLLVFYKEF